MRFHALAWVTSQPHLGKGVNHLYYDFVEGRNLNLLTTQGFEREGKGTLWDFERQDGLSFYYFPRTRACNLIDMRFGLLSPSWLADEPVAELVAADVREGIFAVNVWTKGESDTPGVPFITYYAEVGSNRPVKWIFFDGMTFDIVTYEPNRTLSEAEWTIPAYCPTKPGARPLGAGALPANRTGLGSDGTASEPTARTAPALRQWHARLSAAASRQSQPAALQI
jgi:hypothetical protein